MIFTKNIKITLKALLIAFLAMGLAGAEPITINFIFHIKEPSPSLKITIGDSEKVSLSSVREELEETFAQLIKTSWSQSKGQLKLYQFYRTVSFDEASSGEPEMLFSDETPLDESLSLAQLGINDNSYILFYCLPQILKGKVHIWDAELKTLVKTVDLTVDSLKATPKAVSSKLADKLARENKLIAGLHQILLIACECQFEDLIKPDQMPRKFLEDVPFSEQGINEKNFCGHFIGVIYCIGEYEVMQVDLFMKSKEAPNETLTTSAFVRVAKEQSEQEKEKLALKFALEGINTDERYRECRGCELIKYTITKAEEPKSGADYDCKADSKSNKGTA